MEGSEYGRCSRTGSQDKPCTAAHPEICDRAPEEIDRVGQSEKRNDAGAAAGIDAFEAKDIRESTTDQTDGDYRSGRSEQAEEPRPLVPDGRSFGFSDRDVCRQHEG